MTADPTIATLAADLCRMRAEALLETHPSADVLALWAMLVRDGYPSDVAAETLRALTPPECSMCRRHHGDEVRHACE